MGLSMALCIALGSVMGAGGGLPVEALKTWTIVCAPDATASEAYAAEEFQSLFKRATGTELPISHDAARKQNVIAIGQGAAAVDVSSYGDEQLLIRVGADRIAITGGRPRGSLYGVYEFFERYLGCEFLTYDQTWFPPVADFKPVPSGDYTFTPAFSFRSSYYKENFDHPEFAARQRINTITTDEKLGGKTPQNLIGHSYCKWITAEKYGQTHPEYFAMVNGARQLLAGGGGPQPCVSNPDVIDIVAKAVIEELDQHPDMRNIAVSQNDNDGYCRCPRCTEINTREESPMGANLALVNAVAERVEKAHPGVMVGTLAYVYSRKPPKFLKPRHNVQIQLCSIECCSLHPVNDPGCPFNTSFCRDMEGWRAICDQIWVWNYNTNFTFYDLPLANLKSIGPNVKFFLDSHAKGVFMQANGNGNSGEMCDLRNYVISKCLWNPGLDSWALAERFCRLHYGRAADEIIGYETLLHRVSEEAGLHPDCGPVAERIGLTPEVVREAKGYFGRALEKAEDDAVRMRVEKASISVHKAALMTAPVQWEFKDGFVKRAMPASFQQELDTYADLCQKHNMTMHGELVPLPKFLGYMDVQETLAAVQIENAVWRVTAVPEENGAVVGLFHKPTGHEMLRGNRMWDFEKGVIETAVESGPYQRAPHTAYLAETSPNAITMRHETPFGAVETRVVHLPEETPDQVRVEFTLEQKGPGTHQWRFNALCGFDPGIRTMDAGRMSVYVNSGGWKRVNKDWVFNEGPDAGLMAHPDGGGFAFFNHEDKFGALLRFDPKQVSKNGLLSFPERPLLVMEVHTPTVEVAQGETLKLEYSIQHITEAPESAVPR